jgi:putative ABC transport system permease protein
VAQPLAQQAAQPAHGGAIALAVALVCFLATMPDGMNRILEQVATNTRIVVHNEAGLVYPLPYAYLQKVRAMPGVVAVTSWTWFGGVFSEEDGVLVPELRDRARSRRRDVARLRARPTQLEEFKRRRDGAIVGRGTLEKYGWKIGDEVTLKGTVYPVDLTFKIVGTIPSERAPHFWFQREYLEQAVTAAGGTFDFLGAIWVRVDDPSRIDPLLRQIDETFRNSEAQTSSENEKSYFKNFFGALEGLVFLIMLVTALVAICIVFIAANTASMTVRERMREIAILKAMGFARRTVFGCSSPRRRCSPRSRGPSAHSRRSVSASSCATPRATGTRRWVRSRRSSSRTRSSCRACSWRSSSACSRASYPRSALRGAASCRRCARSSRWRCPCATASATCSRGACAPRSRSAWSQWWCSPRHSCSRSCRACAARSITTGAPSNLIVMRKGATNDGVERAAARGLPGAALFRGRGEGPGRRAARVARARRAALLPAPRRRPRERARSAASSRSRSPCTTR